MSDTVIYVLQGRTTLWLFYKADLLFKLLLVLLARLLFFFFVTTCLHSFNYWLLRHPFVTRGRPGRLKLFYKQKTGGEHGGLQEEWPPRIYWRDYSMEEMAIGYSETLAKTWRGLCHKGPGGSLAQGLSVEQIIHLFYHSTTLYWPCITSQVWFYLWGYNLSYCC